MERISVGMPLVRGVLSLREGIHYNYTVSGHTLIMAVADPDPDAIRAVQRGQAWFGLCRKENAIFILSRFGDLPWTATAYNWWINAPIMRPDPWDDMALLRDGLSAGVCLVNSGTGLVEAIRRVNLSQELGLMLMGMVQDQMKPPFDPWEYLDIVTKTLEENPDAKTLVKDAVCVCIANVAAWQPFVVPPQATTVH